jgi:uncharacterized protein
MPLSLYDVLVPTFTQTLTGLSGVLDKAEAHCAEKGVTPGDCISSRLFADMLPFAYQVKSASGHSVGAIEAVKAGSFSPDMSPPPDTFAALKDSVASSLAALARYTPAEINALEGRDMVFQFREHKLPFTAENFLMSFSLPNFFFHATTAYAILRHNGVALGKRDFMGPLRMKT